MLSTTEIIYAELLDMLISRSVSEGKRLVKE